MADLFETAADLRGYVFRITDSGPGAVDRITVTFCDGDYLALSETGSGFSQWGEGLDVGGLAERVEEGEERDLTWRDLDPALRSHILARANEAWRDFLESEAAADSREAAEVHEGIWNSGGVGIYRDGHGFRIRYDGAAEDDPGPFATFREALRYSLPEDYALSGPEYHPPVDPMQGAED